MKALVKTGVEKAELKELEKPEDQATVQTLRVSIDAGISIGPSEIFSTKSRVKVTS